MKTSIFTTIISLFLILFAVDTITAQSPKVRKGEIVFKGKNILQNIQVHGPISIRIGEKPVRIGNSSLSLQQLIANVDQLQNGKLYVRMSQADRARLKAVMESNQNPNTTTLWRVELNIEQIEPTIIFDKISVGDLTKPSTSQYPQVPLGWRKVSLEW